MVWRLFSDHVKDFFVLIKLCTMPESMLLYNWYGYMRFRDLSIIIMLCFLIRFESTLHTMSKHHVLKPDAGAMPTQLQKMPRPKRVVTLSYLLLLWD